MSKSAAIVTGASTGIGRELARLFARDQRDVVLVARSRDKLTELQAELERTSGIGAHVVDTDLGRPEGPRRVKAAVDELGLTVTHLVNNAGYGSTGPFVDADLEGELAMIDLNVRALVALTGLVLPDMRAQQRGRILNVASTAGFQAGPFMATYYATKAFVISWSEALAVELRGSGVTVTASCPGPVATEFAARAGNDVTRLFKKGVIADAPSVAAHAYAAMERGVVTAIPGLQNKLTVLGSKLSPRMLNARVAAALNRPG